MTCGALSLEYSYLQKFVRRGIIFGWWIVDRFVQNSIPSSHEEVKEIRRKTQEVLLDLESLRKRLDKEEVEVLKEMDRIIRLA